MVGISYDDVSVLASFSKQSAVEFPLLSDPDSTVIKAYNLLNARASGRQAGIPIPATVVVDAEGKVTALLPGNTMKRHTTEDLLKALAD